MNRQVSMLNFLSTPTPGHKMPFILIDWQHNFLEALLNIAWKQSHGHLENCVFIFPHARPARYIERLISMTPEIKKPCLMPEMLHSEQIFRSIHAELGSPKAEISLLDQIGVLLKCVRDEQKENPGTISSLPTTDAKIFFPWGARLARLFEECFIHHQDPTNFLYLEEELAEYAALLLTRLSSLHQRYINELQANDLSTPGFTAYQTASMLLQNQHTPRLAQDGKHIFIAGFHSLTGTEDILFRKLWSDYNATILLHGDIQAADGKGHWSCHDFKAWSCSWKSKIEVYAQQQLEAKNDKPKINFYSGYDRHSQLATLRELLLKKPELLENTAIILPDTALLLPALHHIPTADLNISMGYPLARSPMNLLLECVVNLQKNQRQGGYYWKDCIQLIRHPYIKLLALKDENGRKIWRELLQKLELTLRTGQRYVDFSMLLQKNALLLDSGNYQATLLKLCSVVDSALLKNWQQATTLQDIATALRILCELMFNIDETIWFGFPIDQECLARFTLSVVPQLAGSALAQEPFPAPVLYSILRMLIDAERVPFDAYPLTALQVMGLLESRLLTFKRIFILDATDDILPGAAQNDPLLPDSLRQELLLPTSHRRQHLHAYYFFRLLQGAEEVHLFWQEGLEPKGIQDTKKLKSRFIEELIWNEEQALGRILDPGKHSQAMNTNPDVKDNFIDETGLQYQFAESSALRDGPLNLLSCSLSPVKISLKHIKVTSALRKRLEQYLSETLSATKINLFLRCPLAFYYQELARLQPLEEVIENDDPGGAGELVHQVLRNFYLPQLGKTINRIEKSYTELVNLFKHSLIESNLKQNLPYDTLSTLLTAVPQRLKAYLENQPEETKIQALEVKVNANLQTADGKLFRLTGQLDRIDERTTETLNSGIIILDYKTGLIEPLQNTFWENEFWEQLIANSTEIYTETFFNSIANKLKNIQLPFYLYLGRYGSLVQNSGDLAPGFSLQTTLLNAGWIELRSSGKEKMLLDDSLEQDQLYEIITIKIPSLIGYVLSYLGSCNTFSGRTGKHCTYCPYSKLCLGLL